MLRVEGQDDSKNWNRSYDDGKNLERTYEDGEDWEEYLLRGSLGQFSFRDTPVRR